jgi:uncharacterized tellurite resistance protein B-like protein
MEASPEAWTTAHDLSLVYIALAYGTDYDLADDELNVIVERLSRWNPPDAAVEEEGKRVQQIVTEAMNAYLEDVEEREEHERDVAEAVEALGRELGAEDRRHALEDAMRIAEADGVLLSSEQNLITALADAWDLRETGEQLLGESPMEVEARQEWSLLHDLALVYVVLAHATDEELSEAEIAAILERMQEWHDQISEDEAREVLREVLAFYSEQPTGEALEASMRAIKEVLPVVQRLVALEDLMSLASVEGDCNQHKCQMIEDIAEAWEVPVRTDEVKADGEAAAP